MIRWSKRVIFLSAAVLGFYMCLFMFNNYSLVSPIPDFADSLNGPSVRMDDKDLVLKLRDHFLMPPPGPDFRGPYNLEHPEVADPSMGQAEMVRKYFKNKSNGVFIECGALDGETRSNTLFFERSLNWTGLLIEADPVNFAYMALKNRRAWLSPTCLSIQPYPNIVSFKQDNNLGKISDEPIGIKKPGYVDVQCFPLYTYLLALNMTTVHYMSLDVEGDELNVLKTIPWQQVDIKVLSVEFVHVPGGKDALRDFMTFRGYSVLGTVTHPDWLANDFIFVKS